MRPVGVLGFFYDSIPICREYWIWLDERCWDSHLLEILLDLLGLVDYWAGRLVDFYPNPNFLIW
jgi:hypothetical protein